MNEFLTTKEIDEAWDRLARTADGGIIYRHLMKLVMEVSSDDSALPRREGARSLAHNLMSLMANGIIDNDRYCVAFPGPKPTAVTGPTTGIDTRRKWLASQPSWYDDRETGGAGNSGTGANGSRSGTAD